jgi:DNA-binding CsgD family transcriptional regulator
VHLSNDDYLLRIVQKRVLPGMLLMDEDGKLVSWNANARRILFPNGHYGRILEGIRVHLCDLKRTDAEEVLAKDPSAGPLRHTLFASNETWYAMRAFWLDGEPSDTLRLLAVLLEEVNPSRFDLRLLQERFHLSPREFQVVQVLTVGMTDKQIASEIGVSPATVRGYMKVIRAKLGVSTRTAILQRLLTAPEDSQPS